MADDRAVVLTSGRPSIGLWVLDLETLSWSTFINLADAHNRGLPTSGPMSDPEYRVSELDARVNASSSTISLPAETKAYTALDAMPCAVDAVTCSVVVAYDRLANGNKGPPGPHGLYDRVFSMIIDISTR